MAKVAFWSAENKMAGNTHAVLATSTLMGISHKVTSIVIQSNFNSRKIESAFTPYDVLLETGAFESSNIGISALSRLITSNKLTSDFIQNYAKPVLKNRLDILYGINSKDRQMYEETMSNLTYLTRKANEMYDLVFIDLPKGSTEKYVESTLADADVVVCVLNQDMVKLTEFFRNINSNEILKDKQKIYVIADYDDKSKYNTFNIASRFRIKEPLYTVPHNMMFADACNDGNIVDFFYKNIQAENEKGDYNGKFIASTRQIVEKILDITKVKDA